MAGDPQECRLGAGPLLTAGMAELVNATTNYRVTDIAGSSPAPRTTLDKSAPLRMRFPWANRTDKGRQRIVIVVNEG